MGATSRHPKIALNVGYTRRGASSVVARLDVTVRVRVGLGLHALLETDLPRFFTAGVSIPGG